MLNIAICDDDKGLTSVVEELIYKYDKTNKIDIDVMYSGEELIHNILKNENRYDLIYLDIEMGELDGIETATRIREVDKNVKIIYITSYSGFAMTAYEVNAFRFLTKPIDEMKFEKYYFSAVKEIEKSDKYFKCTFNKENYRLLIDDIIYFQSDKRVTYIKTSMDNIKYYGKLNDIENDLVSKGVVFYRASQSMLVNPRYVYSHKRDKLVLKNNEEVIISKNRQEEILKLFLNMKCSDFNG